LDTWLSYALLSLGLYGLVGMLQKLTTNRISADAALLWYSVGYILPFPLFLAAASFEGTVAGTILLGLLVGFAARSGEYFLFASMAGGGKASVVVPLTSTYPLVTLLLATLFLSERLTHRQWVGIGLAVVAGVLMSCETTKSRR
jgi:bacterial/archaeal transporter family protein